MLDQRAIDLFSYSAEERNAFPYLARYVSAIEPHLQKILESEEARRKFILSGLFLTYRAFNNTGQAMRVEDPCIQLPEIHRRRLEQYSSLGGPSFSSTQEYLSLLGVSRWQVLLKRPESYLAKAVLGSIQDTKVK